MRCPTGACNAIVDGVLSKCRARDGGPIVLDARDYWDYDRTWETNAAWEQTDKILA